MNVMTTITAAITAPNLLWLSGFCEDYIYVLEIIQQYYYKSI